jgi:hypothetical protein
MKNSNDTIGNRNRDLPVCRAVPLRRLAIPIFVIFESAAREPAQIMGMNLPKEV